MRLSPGWLDARYSHDAYNHGYKTARKWQEMMQQQIDEKNQRLASVLMAPGPLGPYHPAHRPRHPAEIPLKSTSAPFLSLPAELHLEIFTHICADENDEGDAHDWLWTVLALRGVSRFFRHSICPVSHMELLQLETTLRATSRKLLACRYCVQLRPAHRFADSQIRRYGVSLDALFAELGIAFKSSAKRGKRFCADCGFAQAIDPNLELEKTRYQKGTDVVVGEDERWVWCWWCSTLKKEKNAGGLRKDACRGSCATCCREHECKGKCVFEEQEKRRMIAQEVLEVESALEAAVVEEV